MGGDSVALLSFECKDWGRIGGGGVTSGEATTNRAETEI